MTFVLFFCGKNLFASLNFESNLFFLSLDNKTVRSALPERFEGKVVVVRAISSGPWAATPGPESRPGICVVINHQLHLSDFFLFYI